MATSNINSRLAIDAFEEQRDLTFTVIQYSYNYQFCAFGESFEISGIDLFKEIVPQIVENYNQVHFEKKYAIFNENGQKVCDLDDSEDIQMRNGWKVCLVAQRIFSPDR